ncbi:hypothetical protein CPB83DRAFT_848924 [Crepidotus variabilis]|uniref:Transmembrane protein n=1 Tax=Crepidotus variabilis TaxID=179855 RepID=A0A9P6JSI6_9AGAR|nr:hypothetical protein CPB83DRAFT_848924 [Crepidotus variabilis]
MSSASITQPEAPVHDDEEPKRRLTRVPLWVPISAFVGTSLALGIPLLLLRRQRSVLRISLKDGKSAPPPRRAIMSAENGKMSSLPPLTPTANPPLPDNLFSSPDTEMEKASLGDMMSGLSRMNKSSALMAAKAFAIATGLVAVGGAAFVWAVKERLGVRDAREFGTQMRLFLSANLPSLSAAIYKPPEPLTDEERRELILQKLDAASIAEAQAASKWKWDDAEERLKKAYDEGGVGLWAQVALRELEAESHIEREKREEELKNIQERTS